MARHNTIKYELHQIIDLANGQAMVNVIGSCLGDNDGVARLIQRRNGYRGKGYNVDLIKTTTNTITETIEG